MNSDFETPFGMVVLSSTLIIAMWFIFAEMAVPAHTGHLFLGLFSRARTHGRALSPRMHCLSPIGTAAACPCGVEAQGGAPNFFKFFAEVRFPRAADPFAVSNRSLSHQDHDGIAPSRSCRCSLSCCSPRSTRVLLGLRSGKDPCCIRTSVPVIG